MPSITLLESLIRNLHSYRRHELIAQGKAIKVLIELQRQAGMLSEEAAAQFESGVNNETSRILKGADKQLYMRPDREHPFRDG